MTLRPHGLRGALTQITATDEHAHMFFRHLDLTSALRPSLFDDETLLFVQNGIGLYEGSYKLTNYQDGHTYLTSHRICYVDNAQPRKFSVAVELKEIDRTEFYAGFLKSSAKITLVSKPLKTSLRGPVPRHGSPTAAVSGSPTRSIAPSPAPPRETNATWICKICGMSNAVPTNFDANTANQHTPLPPCQACGIKPDLIIVVRAAIAAMSNRIHGGSATVEDVAANGNSKLQARPGLTQTPSGSYGVICARCTFENHPSLTQCELCGASLATSASRDTFHVVKDARRPSSPGPASSETVANTDTIEIVKLAFRAGGEKVFQDRLKNALVQRKWLLQSAPPIPRPDLQAAGSNFGGSGTNTPRRVVGIAGLEQRGVLLRQQNQTVIGTAFEDLEALMTSAKEVIAMAEQFKAQSSNGGGSMSAEARSILSDSASVLGLTTTKDMLGSGSSSDTLYITELSRTLAEFLTDDRRGVLRREGGIISLVDLWAVFNRTRNGIELVSPAEFERAAQRWDTLNMPIRLRRFKSGVLVVQERSRTDDRTIATLIAWLQEPSAGDHLNVHFGRGVTAIETAEKFHWSIGVATEELEMAEEAGALCRDQCLDGVRFWQNQFERFVDHTGDTLQMMTDLNVN